MSSGMVGVSGWMALGARGDQPIGVTRRRQMTREQLSDTCTSGQNDVVAQQDVAIILARQFASELSVAVLVVDSLGDTLFFNEPAERILGRPFHEVDALPFEERAAILAPRGDDGRPMPVEQLPGMVAMREHRPAHVSFHMHGLDGILRPIEATAIPLLNAGGHVLGAFVVLWARSDDVAAPPPA